MWQCQPRLYAARQQEDAACREDKGVERLPQKAAGFADLERDIQSFNQRLEAAAGALQRHQKADRKRCVEHGGLLADQPMQFGA